MALQLHGKIGRKRRIISIMDKTIQIRHVRQPDGSNLCGQCCVAAILGATLQNTIAKMKKKGRTKTTDLVSALKLDRDTRRLRGTPKPPCILSVKKDKSGNWHWVVFDGMWVMDPELDGLIAYHQYIETLGSVDMRISSYLPLV